MKVTVNFHGILAEWVGVSGSSLDLPLNADYADLLADIGHRFGPNMPGQLWDLENKMFKGPIQAIGKGRTLTSRDTPLIEGEEITFIFMAAGG